MDSKCSNLLRDLLSMLTNGNDHDVIIQVGENQNMKEFRAHSNILRARSNYFKSALSADWVIKKNDLIEFSKPNINPTIFEIILKYIYTGEVDVTGKSGIEVLGLIIASDELLLEELFNFAQDYFIRKQSTWIYQNFIFIINTVFRLSSCKRLQDYCLESICADPQLLITSKNFPSLDKDILYDIFKRDELQIEEIVAWDCLIKWGIEQSPGLKDKNDEWDKKDYEELEKTLNRFIPLIQFVEIPRADFFEKVHPYKAIIPNDIYKEVEELYNDGTLPKIMTGKIESTIIKPILANIITNLIDKKNDMFICARNNSHYKFNLIYNGSRDMINNISFKKKCNGQVASLVLIKIQESDKIFGGYSSIGFNSVSKSGSSFDTYGSRFYYSPDNFIFSFENSEDTKNMKISRVIKRSKAILDYYSNGFNFGWGSLCMNDQNLFASNYYGNYESNLNTNDIFTIKEIEVFEVTK